MRYLFLIVAFFCFPVFSKSKIEQLDIIGIKPGVSTQQEIKEIMYLDRFEIGGVSMDCGAEYSENGVLSQLGCPLSEKVNTSDATQDYKNISNVVAFEILKRGFTKKFGKPSTVISEEYENIYGKKVRGMSLGWADRKGNVVLLKSHSERVDVGSLTIKSSEKVKSELSELIKGEARRKF